MNDEMTMVAANEVLRRSRELTKAGRDQNEREGLLEKLPQGHGSGLDADMVDGLHAADILAKSEVLAHKVVSQVAMRGGGGGIGEHGNEFHSPDFATQADLDTLSQDFFGIMLPPEGKTITKKEYTWNADDTLTTLKAYDGVTLLFTLAYSWNDDKTLKEIVRTDA